jgi:hypothetical protein
MLCRQYDGKILQRDGTEGCRQCTWLLVAWSLKPKLSQYTCLTGQLIEVRVLAAITQFEGIRRARVTTVAASLQGGMLIDATESSPG